MAASTPGLSRVLFLSALVIITVSGSQKCLPQLIPDMVIDINNAVAHGARFTDPLSVSSEEECLNLCCMQRERGGDRACNLLVFDARKGPGVQNCYIFYCPNEDSCPLSPTRGVLTYSFLSASSPGKQRPKSSDGGGGKTDNRKSGGAITTQHAEEETAPKSIAHQLLHLADKIDQRLEKMESESESDIQVHYPTTTTVPPPTTWTTTTPIHKEVKKVVHPAAKVAKPGGVTHEKPDIPDTVPTRTSTRLVTSAPQPLPPAAKKASDKSAKPPGGGHVTAVAPKPRTQRPALTTVHHSRAPQEVTVTHPTPLKTSSWKDVDKPSAGDDEPGTTPQEEAEPAINLEEGGAPRKAAGGALPFLEDKSGLVAALVFGLLFLLVVIGLVSRKVSEARRRHRYTKLDYLINGMYVDT